MASPYTEIPVNHAATPAAAAAASHARARLSKNAAAAATAGALVLLSCLAVLSHPHTITGMRSAVTDLKQNIPTFTFSRLNTVPLYLSNPSGIQAAQHPPAVMPGSGAVHALPNIDSNACATSPYGVCTGTLDQPESLVVRQCSHGAAATECRCFGNGATLLSAKLAYGRCFCSYKTPAPGKSTWSMYLFCKPTA